MKSKRLTAAREWLTEHGHKLNLTVFGQACGVSKQMLSLHRLGKTTLSDANAEAVAKQLEKIGVKMPS